MQLHGDDKVSRSTTTEISQQILSGLKCSADIKGINFNHVNEPLTIQLLPL